MRSCATATGTRTTSNAAGGVPARVLDLLVSTLREEPAHAEQRELENQDRDSRKHVVSRISAVLLLFPLAYAKEFTLFPFPSRRRCIIWPQPFDRFGDGNVSYRERHDTTDERRRVELLDGIEELKGRLDPAD